MERAYLQPADLRDAFSILAKHPDAKIVAGGTDLIVAARSSKTALPPILVAIDRLRGLEVIKPTSKGGLHIGALVTHRELETSNIIQGSWSALSDAAALVGSPATRSVGTIGGNVCNASPAMDLGSPLLVFDATVELASSRGRRRMSMGSFLIGPRETARQLDELLTAIILPPLPSPGTSGSAYIRLEYRQAMEIAIVGAAALISVGTDGQCTDVRISLTAVAPTCIRASAAEMVLKGKIVDSDSLAEAARSAVSAAKPIDDVRAPAGYRRAMVPVIVQRALKIAWDRAKDQVVK